MNMPLIQDEHTLRMACEMNNIATPISAIGVVDRELHQDIWLDTSLENCYSVSILRPYMSLDCSRRG
jgi:hypothetical protein